MLIQQLDLTNYERILCFGDIHGELDLLFEANILLNANQNSYSIAAGDVMDRGERSFDAAMHFLTAENRLSVLGNHEDMFVQGWLKGDRHSALNHLLNGGEWTDKYDTETLQYLAKRIDKHFPAVLKVQFHDIKLAVAHADLPLNINEKNVGQSLKTILWNHKSHEADKEIKGINLAIHGHKILPTPQLNANRIYIDTGAGILSDELDLNYGLTCLEILKDNVYLHRFHKLYNGRVHYDVLSDKDPLIQNLKQRLFGSY